MTLITKGMKQPDANWCWLALGSQGRGEQLLRTDQDNALVFADVPAEDYDATKDYFLQLAQYVNKGLANTYNILYVTSSNG